LELAKAFWSDTRPKKFVDEIAASHAPTREENGSSAKLDQSGTGSLAGVSPEDVSGPREGGDIGNAPPLRGRTDGL
jgi:hypothetical protein